MFKRVDSKFFQPRWIVLFLLLIVWLVYSWTKPIIVKGRVYDHKGQPLSGANVVVATHLSRAIGLFHGSLMAHDYRFFETNTAQDGTFEVEVMRRFGDSSSAPKFVIMKHGYRVQLRQTEQVPLSNFGEYEFHLVRPKNAIDQFQSLTGAKMALSTKSFRITCALVNVDRELEWLGDRGVYTTPYRISRRNKLYWAKLKDCEGEGLSLTSKENLPDVLYSARTLEELINPLLRAAIVSWQYADRGLYKQFANCFPPYVPDWEQRPSRVALDCLREFSRHTRNQRLLALIEKTELNKESDLKVAYADFINAMKVVDETVRKK